MRIIIMMFLGVPDSTFVCSFCWLVLGNIALSLHTVNTSVFLR